MAANDKDNKYKAFIDDVTRSVKESSGADLAFGKPIEKEGVTVIPVARVKGGGGGGRGSGPKEGEKKKDKGEGAGFGFGVDTIPYGYLEIKNGEAEFYEIEPPIDKNTIIKAGIAAGTVATLLLAKMYKRKKD